MCEWFWQDRARNRCSVPHNAGLSPRFESKMPVWLHYKHWTCVSLKSFLFLKGCLMGYTKENATTTTKISSETQLNSHAHASPRVVSGWPAGEPRRPPSDLTGRFYTARMTTQSGSSLPRTAPLCQPAVDEGDWTISLTFFLSLLCVCVCGAGVIRLLETVCAGSKGGKKKE